MRTFLPIAALALLAGTHAIEVGTSPPPTLKYSDFVFDGKTTYCYTVLEGIAAAMYVYTELGLEGKGDECPLQLSLEQTTTGEVSVNQNVVYKLTATVSLSSKNLFNATALAKVVDDPYLHKPVQISRANVHACASSSTCDAFRKGNSSRASKEESGIFTNGTVTFAPKLNFTSPDTYTVLAYVVVPPSSENSGFMRFVAFTTTTVGGSKSNATNIEDVPQANATTVPAPSSSSPLKEKSAAATSKLGATMVAGVAFAASLLLTAF